MPRRQRPVCRQPQRSKDARAAEARDRSAIRVPCASDSSSSRRIAGDARSRVGDPWRADGCRSVGRSGCAAAASQLFSLSASSSIEQRATIRRPALAPGRRGPRPARHRHGSLQTCRRDDFDRPLPRRAAAGASRTLVSLPHKSDCSLNPHRPASAAQAPRRRVGRKISRSGVKSNAHVRRNHSQIRQP